MKAHINDFSPLDLSAKHIAIIPELEFLRDAEKLQAAKLEKLTAENAKQRAAIHELVEAVAWSDSIRTNHAIKALIALDGGKA